jgi:hypothetical protein
MERNGSAACAMSAGAGEFGGNPVDAQPASARENAAARATCRIRLKVREARARVGADAPPWRERGECLAFVDERRAFAVDQHFGRSAVVVVVRHHRHAVGPGREDRHQVALLHRGNAAIAREEVAGLADRSHEVAKREAGKVGLLEPARRGALPGDGPDEVEGAIERRSDERLHAGVAHDEGLRATLLDVLHARHEDPGVGEDRATGLEHDREAGTAAIEEEGTIASVLLEWRHHFGVGTGQPPPGGAGGMRAPSSMSAEHHADRPTRLDTEREIRCGHTAMELEPGVAAPAVEHRGDLDGVVRTCSPLLAVSCTRASADQRSIDPQAKRAFVPSSKRSRRRATRSIRC